MGSPCELLVEPSTEESLTRLANIVANEAWRIEDKFSRYLNGNIIDRINSAEGAPISVDAETAQLFDFAASLHGLSEGLFDITSGILREVWNFDSGDAIPSQEAIQNLLPKIGWQLVDWRPPVLKLAAGMQLDLGGIGKEYAVDRAIQLLRDDGPSQCLVNFGGDLAVTGPTGSGRPWKVGIDPGKAGHGEILLALRQGALATSGDVHRYLESDGVRYSHVLNPKTGWPIASAPASITVAADTCIQAGMLSTLAMLKGAEADAFLLAQTERHWIRRDPLGDK
jgi:thiamine biosynthesis lipoprotein